MSTKKSPKIAICQNPECGLEFKVGPGTKGLYCSLSCSTKTTSSPKKEKIVREVAYLQNPKLCLCCKTIIPYNKHKQNKYCSSSCSASVNNVSRVTIRRPKQLVIKKNSNKITPEMSFGKKRLIFNKNIVGDYSKIYINSCIHCSNTYVSRHKQRYCNEHKSVYKSKRFQYMFTFNIYNYPKLFDLNLLDEMGFYAPGGKSGHYNINGLARDHKISISEAIKNNYDPFYIKHPLNCQLLTQAENKKKGTRSSISYSELVKIVDQYESGALTQD